MLFCNPFSSLTWTIPTYIIIIDTSFCIIMDTTTSVTFLLRESQPQQYRSSYWISYWTSPQSLGSSLHSQEVVYQSSNSLLGEAVALLMDIDRLQTSQTYPSSCRGCDQLKINIDTLQCQLYELQQTYSVYNTPGYIR